MKITKEMKLSRKEKLEILKKWNHREVGFGEINYVEYLIIQKIMPYLVANPVDKE
jgi:hypothetical protein